MATLIVGATVIDGSGAAPVEGSFVYVEGDRIREVGRGAPPKRADRVIDLEGRSLLPGLIDLHVHLCWDGTLDPVVVNEREGPEMTLLRTAGRARATLEKGVTTVRDVGSGSPSAPHPALFRELDDLVSRGGLSPLEAITAAIATNARALGLEHEIGRIAPGLAADLLVVDGNPASDVRALERTFGVMQAGRWVRLEGRTV